MTVLLVEDDADLGEMYKLQLGQAGWQVVIADNAQAALDALDRAAVEVIVLDILLPLSNGLSLLYELRSYSDWSKIPVIILSNVPVKEIGLAEAALERLGVMAYLDKTRTNHRELITAVQAVSTANA
ncbi:response regulator transcription factor [Candidatus Microgenomates bacterium]|nr:response regulator transcription factor [Candidatus Microgenomates bacterium]